VAALYVMLYTAGRGWIEMLRIDDVQLTDVGGLRFNVWTSIVLFVLATAYLVWSRRRHPEREEQVLTDERLAALAAETAQDPVPPSGGGSVRD
jgi:prolipoprotein diacylglyceryltransferase